MRFLRLALLVGLACGGRAAHAQIAQPPRLQNVPPIVIQQTGVPVCFHTSLLVNGLIITAGHLTGSGNTATITANAQLIWLGNKDIQIGGGEPIPPGGRDSAGASNRENDGICINGTVGDGAFATGN